MKKYKFDDADRVKQLIGFIKTQSDAVYERLEGNESGHKTKEILEAQKELLDLIEENTLNHRNICNMGGMSALLILIVAHEDDEVRQGCCRIFNTITANNPRVQDFATRLGAVNLMG